MKKKFDAVEFQRRAREKLSMKYNSDRETFSRELKEKFHPIMNVDNGIHNQSPKTQK